LAASTLNRHMRQRGYDTERMTREPAAVRYQAERANMRAERWFNAKQRQGGTSANGQAGYWHSTVPETSLARVDGAG
jgi:hypothetical protein